MKIKIFGLVGLAFAGLFYCSIATAQNAGTVTNHALPIGKGAAVQGYGSLLLGSGQIPMGQSSADPTGVTPAGDVTIGLTGTTAIGANKVTNTQIRQSGALSLIGRSANSTGNVADIQATAGSSCAFIESGSSLICGQLVTAGIANSAVTNAKLANSATGATFKGNTTATAGAQQDFTLSGLTALASPSSTLDLIPCWDHVAGTIKSCTPGSIAGSVVAGVSSIDTLTGAFTTANGIKSTGNVIASNNSMGANKYQVFNGSNTSGTITVPTGAAWAKFTITGSGGGASGGGGSPGNGTGGGSTCIAASGAACTSPISAGLGGGGGNFSTAIGGAGGTTSGTCNASFTGGNGGPDVPPPPSGATSGSSGGNALYGGAGSNSFGNIGGQSGSANTGAGGQGGGAAAGSFGGAGGGAGGTCINFIQSPAGTYTYQIGILGPGGNAGTSGSAGGNGGAGIIIAEFGFN